MIKHQNIYFLVLFSLRVNASKWKALIDPLSSPTHKLDPEESKQMHWTRPGSFCKQFYKKAKLTY